MFNFNTMPKGFNFNNEEKVIVEIPLSNGETWNQVYNQNDNIEKIINDFKRDNNEEIPNEYMDDWRNKNPVFNTNDEIKTLLPKQISNILVDQAIERRPLVIGDIKISNMIGKPFNDPFEVFVFDKRDKSLKIQKYENEKIENVGLDNYGPSSAYCNGNNNLFISGGEKKIHSAIVDELWRINLENQNIDKANMPPKKNHSMIYIPGNYIFIVGGNDLKTFYYDNENNEIRDWCDLNRKRIEPALALITNTLYCFDNTNSKNNEKFTFEKTDLTSNNPEWQIITPQIQPYIGKMNQKFFGVLKSTDNNIIFVGGNMDGDGQNQLKNNYLYNINMNTIESSNLPFGEYNLKEKTFLSYNDNLDYIMPDFNRHHPEVLFYQKNKNKLNLVKYEPSRDNRARKRPKSKPFID